MEAFAWEPPDRDCLELQVSWGHGSGRAGNDDRAHRGAESTSCGDWDMGEEAGPRSQEAQLDLGLTDTTKYFSYSKLWRTLYFVNDAPFCIHHLGFNGNWHPVQRCNGSRCSIRGDLTSIM